MDITVHVSIKMQAPSETSLFRLQSLLQTKIQASKNKRKEIATIVSLNVVSLTGFNKRIDDTLFNLIKSY